MYCFHRLRFVNWLINKWLIDWLESKIMLCWYLHAVSIQLYGYDVSGRRCRQSPWRHDRCQVHYVISDVNSHVHWWPLDWPAYQLYDGQSGSVFDRALCRPLSRHGLTAKQIETTQHSQSPNPHRGWKIAIQRNINIITIYFTEYNNK